jgi:predicted esterase
MSRAHRQSDQANAGEIIDFDEALLNACSPALLSELMAEAELLAGAFAPRRKSADFERMAAQLSAGQRDDRMSRAHARRLAAALRRLGRLSAG